MHNDLRLWGIGPLTPRNARFRYLLARNRRVRDGTWGKQRWQPPNMENLGKFSETQTAGQRPKLQFTISQQLEAHFESRFFIHLEQKGRCPSDWRATDNFGTHKSKMLLPGFCPWVENRHERSGLRVDGREIRSLEAIAERTGDARLAASSPPRCCLARTCSTWKVKKRRGLRKPTVFAPLACALADEFACRGTHQEEVCLRKNSRAFACKIVTK